MAHIVFAGEYNSTLDEKGRLLLPIKLRGAVTDAKIVITRGIDCCLWGFSTHEWTALSEKVMQSASLFRASSRLVLRRLIAPAQEVDIDKSGRISIPHSLREYACLERECVILGICRYVEFWNAAKYNAYLERSEADFSRASEDLEIVRF